VVSINNANGVWNVTKTSKTTRTLKTSKTTKPKTVTHGGRVLSACCLAPLVHHDDELLTPVKSAPGSRAGDGVTLTYCDECGLVLHETVIRLALAEAQKRISALFYGVRVDVWQNGGGSSAPNTESALKRGVDSLTIRVPASGSRVCDAIHGWTLFAPSKDFGGTWNVVNEDGAPMAEPGHFDLDGALSLMIDAVAKSQTCGMRPSGFKGACGRCGRTNVLLRPNGKLCLHDTPTGAACTKAVR
jgi:hypothetical protein